VTREQDNPSSKKSTAELSKEAEKLTSRLKKAEYTDQEIAEAEEFIETQTTLSPTYEIARDTLFVNDVFNLQEIEEELGERGKNN